MAQIAAIEPAIRCSAGLFSPSTGIVDSHAFMLSLLAAAEADGATLALDTMIARIEPVAAGFAITLTGDDWPFLTTREIVNAGGLAAWSIAGMIDGLSPATLPPRHLAKGSYFALAGRSPFCHLVYPVPEPGGLGIHLTLDMAGQARFGPDVEWCDAEDFTVDKRRVDRFYTAIRRYWPALPDGALVPAYAGIRPKLGGPGEAAADFRIDGAERHGLPGLINLFGIESPGLTASLAIAAEVECRLS
jgi:L-2-hydroxyglutarate oxidase LhgO